MVLTRDQLEQLNDAARPLIEFLNTLGHPHVKVIVDCDSAELSEEVARIVNKEFLPD